jgi:hypothetical protein
MTDEDRAAILANARKADLRVSEYVRRAAVNGHIVVTQQSGFSFAVADQLRRIGVNINQQTRVANARGELPAELARLWARLEDMLDRISRTE